MTENSDHWWISPLFLFILFALILWARSIALKDHRFPRDPRKGE